MHELTSELGKHVRAKTERLPGWWLKERYRTMRGYQREEAIKNVVFLTARMGIRSGHYDMAELFA